MKRQAPDDGDEQTTSQTPLVSSKRSKLDAESSDGQTSSSIFQDVTAADFVNKYRRDLPAADVYYQEQLIESEKANGWFDELCNLDTWYHPTLKVYGKTVKQSRAIAAYANTPGLTVHYSHTDVVMHYIYPPVLKEIQDCLEKALGVTFNHVMLNKYEDGSVYIGKHSDTLENKVIASLSLGAERKFVMSPRKGVKGTKISWVLANGSLIVMQGDTQKNWYHEIPKEKAITTGRISLTFRQLEKT